MKLNAELNNEKHAVEIKRDGDKVFAEIDGRRYELEVSEPEPDVYLLTNEGKVYEVRVAHGASLSDPFSVRLGSNEFDIKIIDPKLLRSVGVNQEHGEGLAEIKTAMPGKVVRIIAETGASVQKGDGVIVVEAMKMQNEMKSPKDGVVKEIRVTEGSTVNAGEVLVVIE
jgi:biotin carboxyl carrier protein